MQAKLPNVPVKSSGSRIFLYARKFAAMFGVNLLSKTFGICGCKNCAKVVERRDTLLNLSKGGVAGIPTVREWMPMVYTRSRSCGRPKELEFNDQDWMFH
jgi:hypothetical protein